MTIEEVKKSLGKIVAIGGNSFYEIIGFCEEPVVILKLKCANPFLAYDPETIEVRLPRHLKLGHP